MKPANGLRHSGADQNAQDAGKQVQQSNTSKIRWAQIKGVNGYQKDRGNARQYLPQTINAGMLQEISVRYFQGNMLSWALIGAVNLSPNG